MDGLTWDNVAGEHIELAVCLNLRMGTGDAGCCRKRQPCRMETCGTEEPDEGKLHVRLWGGVIE